MRNFEERKAEIFRRSEERINERRKNRRRIVACCVPLCLCIAVLTAIYIPKKNEKSGSTNNYGYSQPAEEFPYTSLELVGNNTELSNSADIKDIYEIINSAFETDSALSDQSDGKGIVNGSNKSKSQRDVYDTNALYTFKFSSSDGKQAVYTLSNNTLTNETTKTAVVISDEQLEKLYEIIETATADKEETE